MREQKINPEIKEQIINRIKNEGSTVVDVAKDHGIAENTIYAWIAKKADECLEKFNAGVKEAKRIRGYQGIRTLFNK